MKGWLKALLCLLEKGENLPFPPAPLEGGV